MLLLYRSKNIKAGRLTRFSILETWLCCKFNKRSRSSPSRSGMCVRSRLSRLSRSGLAFLSDGFLYTTNTPGIQGNSANMILSSSSTLLTIPFLSKYLYRSSSSLAASSKKYGIKVKGLLLTVNVYLLAILCYIYITAVNTNIWYACVWC